MMSTFFSAQSDAAAVSDLRAWSENQLIAAAKSEPLRDQLHDDNVVLREQIDQPFMFEEIVGTSAGLKGLLSRLMKVAPTDSSVLVSGETGTGRPRHP